MSRLSPLNRQHRGKIVIDPRNPEAVAECDGCGFWVMHSELRERRQYRGGWSPVGEGIWVCKSCDDVPQPYYRRQVLGPDPVPVDHPRPDPKVTVVNAGTGTSPTPAQLATQGVWINVAFPPASTATILFVTTASALGQQGWFGGG